MEPAARGAFSSELTLALAPGCVQGCKVLVDPEVGVLLPTIIRNHFRALQVPPTPLHARMPAAAGIRRQQHMD
jgi:hypothetical protein